MKISKLYITLLLSTGYITNLNAQVIVPPPIQKAPAAKQVQKVAAPLNWQHLSFEKDSVYGVESIKAYKTLPKSKKKIIVAILDSGIDTAHTDLKNVLWTNRKEVKGNGKDDDGNGYVDDIHGWNFLGSKDGKVNIVKTNLEADRMYGRLKNQYGTLSFDDFRKAPQYALYRNVVAKSTVGSKEMAVEIVKNLTIANEKIVERMQKENPSKVLRFSDYTAYQLTDSVDLYAKHTVGLMAAFIKVPDTALLKPFIKKFTRDMIVSNEQDYLKVKGTATDNRLLIGDDYNQNSSAFYGNNILSLPHAEHGTHVAGIVAAQRNNGIGIDGIADQVSLMIVRVVPDGDEYDKDIANGIRYAVDNGANIINMSFGKFFSPQKQWVDEAIKYAEQNGVLIVKAAGNDAQNVDVTETFPSTVFLDKTKAVNVINVGASTPQAKAAPFSNYGQTMVDLFAPGTEIYSTVPGSDYKKMQGTSMACPVVTGVAALVWSRYPKLTYSQLKDVLLKSVTKVPGTTPLPGAANSTEVQFSTLSVSGGIVNAYEALKLAKTYK